MALKLGVKYNYNTRVKITAMPSLEREECAAILLT